MTPEISAEGYYVGTYDEGNGRRWAVYHTDGEGGAFSCSGFFEGSVWYVDAVKLVLAPNTLKPEPSDIEKLINSVPVLREGAPNPTENPEPLTALQFSSLRILLAT